MPAKTILVAYGIIKFMFKEPPIVIVAAMTKPKQVIGNNNQLLWHIPDDLKHFKALTLGKPVIMGRKTFTSIVTQLGKPLPNRTNIVITRDTSYKYEGVKIAHSLREALELAKDENPEEIHIGGGGEIYKQALPLVSKLHITWVNSDITGDTIFPDFLDEFKIINVGEMQTQNGVEFQWIDYERK